MNHSYRILVNENVSICGIGVGGWGEGGVGELQNRRMADMIPKPM